MDIYVGNLPWKVDDKDLDELFSQYGEVSSAKVIKYKDSNRSKGFGFVEMDDDSAAKAIEALEGFDLLSVTEGIIPALEPAHAIGFLDKFMKKTEKDEKLVLLVSGRGDKDLDTVISARN